LVFFGLFRISLFRLVFKNREGGGKQEDKKPRSSQKRVNRVGKKAENQ
jgi:hypothetical protein